MVRGAYCRRYRLHSLARFLQAVANEQAGRLPGLVLRHWPLTSFTESCIACPIRRRDRDWSFHVAIPDSDEIRGVLQADHCASPRGSSADPVSYASSESVIGEVRAMLTIAFRCDWSYDHMSAGAQRV